MREDNAECCTPEEIICNTLQVRGPDQKDIQVQYVEPAPTEPTRFTEYDFVQTPNRDGSAAPMWWTFEIFSGALITTATGAAREDVPSGDSLLGESLRCNTGRVVLRYDGDIIRFDIGRGGRYSLCANNVSAKLEFPDPSIRISGAASGASSARGLTGIAPNTRLSNVEVMGQFRSNIAPVGRRTAFFTQTVNVAAGVQRLIPIPNRAIGFQAYQQNGRLPQAPTVMEWSNTLTIGGGVGEISWVQQHAAVQAQTQKLWIPGNACFVNTGPDERNMSFVWELEL